MRHVIRGGLDPQVDGLAARQALGIQMAGDVSDDCTRDERRTVGWAGLTPWESALWGPTHTSLSNNRRFGSCSRTLTEATGRSRPSHPARPGCCAARSSLCNERRISAGESSVGTLGSRTLKAKDDLVISEGQAIDVCRQPRRARDRHEAQQGHAEQRHESHPRGTAAQTNLDASEWPRRARQKVRGRQTRERTPVNSRVKAAARPRGRGCPVAVAV